MEKTYDPHSIEETWYQRWEDEGYFAASGDGDPYCIVIPPPNEIPAFRKLGLETASPDFSLKIVETANSAIDRTEALLRYQG